MSQWISSPSIASASGQSCSWIASKESLVLVELDPRNRPSPRKRRRGTDEIEVDATGSPRKRRAIRSPPPRQTFMIPTSFETPKRRRTSDVPLYVTPTPSKRARRDRDRSPPLRELNLADVDDADGEDDGSEAGDVQTPPQSSPIKPSPYPSPHARDLRCPSTAHASPSSPIARFEHRDDEADPLLGDADTTHPSWMLQLLASDGSPYCPFTERKDQLPGVYLPDGSRRRLERWYDSIAFSLRNRMSTL